ncbi:hypothetical protein ABPG72_013442 [Tetrahymena utriculariae]
MTQNISTNNNRYLMQCEEEINDNCQQLICQSAIIDDFDISNYTEYVISFFLMGQFLVSMSRYIIWLAIACTCRPLFNLLLVLDVFDGIQCFQYVKYSQNYLKDNTIFILENTKNIWSIILIIFALCNNISLIPLTILLSPRNKFRENKLYPFVKSLQEDFIQSYQKEDSVSNIDAENKSCANNL